MTEASVSIQELDGRHVVHPAGRLLYGPESPALVIKGGSGSWLWDDEGNRYLDAIAGLICVNVGYGRQELLDALHDLDLNYATLFFGRTHADVAALSQDLARICPTGVEHFFFCASGSEANDSAMRFARMLHVAEGSPERVKILARLGSYHGATLATLSAGGERHRHRAIGLRMPGFVDLSQPVEGFDAISELRYVIANEGPETIAALIAEPIAFQAGMIVPPPDYWPAVQSLCEEFGILLIVDEVLTGFGRTGAMFASEHWNVRPDMLVMSKGLTSGYLPMAALGVSNRLMERMTSAFDDSEGVLGFTSSGHPASSRVARANLHVIDRENLVAQSAAMGKALETALGDVLGTTGPIREHRVFGLMAGIDVEAGSDEESRRLCRAIVADMCRGGVFARPFGRTVALAPPLIVTEDEIGVAVESLKRAVDNNIARN